MASVALNPAPITPPTAPTVDHGSLQGKEVTRLDRFRGFLERTELLETVAKVWVMFALIVPTAALIWVGMAALSIEGVVMPTLAMLVPLIKIAALGAAVMSLSIVAGLSVESIVDAFSSKPDRNANVWGIESALSGKNYYHAKCLMSQAKLTKDDKDRLFMDIVEQDDPIALQLIIMQLGLSGHELGSYFFKPVLDEGISLKTVQVLVDAGYTFQANTSPHDCLPPDANDRDQIIALINAHRSV